MNLVDKIMNYLSMYDEEIIDEEQEEREAAAKAEAAKEKKDKRFSFFRKKPIEQPQEEVPNEVPERNGKAVLQFNKPGVSEEAAPQGKMGSRTLNLPIADKLVTVVVLEPVDFNDSQKIADFLRSNQPVVVNFTNTDNVVAKRMTDFISGTVYALNGSMKKLGRNILVCAPKNVDIDAGVAEPEERGTNPWEH